MPGGLAAEALGMLWAVLQDFRQWGAVRTITALDPRFEQRIPGLCRKTLPADEVICAGAGDHEEVYLSLLKRCDAVLVIAPETDGILSRLAEQAETEGIPLLGCSAAAVATAGNKAVCSRLFDLANLPAPKARTATFSTAAHVAAQVGCPLVIKPLDGVGCDGVCRLSSLSDLPEILALIRLVHNARTDSTAIPGERDSCQRFSIGCGRRLPASQLESPTDRSRRALSISGQPGAVSTSVKRSSPRTGEFSCRPDSRPEGVCRSRSCAGGGSCGID